MNTGFELEKLAGKPRGSQRPATVQRAVLDKLKREAEIAAYGLTPLDYMMMQSKAGQKPLISP